MADQIGIAISGYPLIYQTSDSLDRMMGRKG